MNTFKEIVGGLCLSALVSLTACNTAPKNECTANEGCTESKNVVIETIMARRSIRAYKDCPVEREKLEQIVECGINAPSGLNKQPWEVRVVDKAEYINGITEIFKKANPDATKNPAFKNMFNNAPAVIFIGMPKDGWGALDCGLLGENMLIAAQSLGLGTCCLGGPIGFMKGNAEAAPYVERLGFSDDYELLYAIAVGYPDETPEARPRETAKAKFVE